MQSSRQQNCTWSLRAESPIDKQADSPLGLISEVLVGLYGHVEGHYSGTGAQSEEERVREQALAASCPVCCQWCKIVMSIWRGGVLLGHNEATLSSLLPYCTLRSTQVTTRLNRITTGWVRVDPPQFPQELLPHLIPWIRQYMSETVLKSQQIKRTTLAACCLVSREWNRLFTPILYEDITLPSDEPRHLESQSLLLRTFRNTQPGHKDLVRTIWIQFAKDGSTANLLSVCFSMPNLRSVILLFHQFDPTSLHPNFAQNLHSLSRHCSVQMGTARWYHKSVKWESFHRCISFIRRSKLNPCRIGVGSGGK